MTTFDRFGRIASGFRPPRCRHCKEILFPETLPNGSNPHKCALPDADPAKEESAK